jgi:hypothetical protein
MVNNPSPSPPQIRLGVTADDQKTLHLAELRHIVPAPFPDADD